MLISSDTEFAHRKLSYWFGSPPFDSAKATRGLKNVTTPDVRVGQITSSSDVADASDLVKKAKKKYNLQINASTMGQYLAGLLDPPAPYEQGQINITVYLGWYGINERAFYAGALGNLLSTRKMSLRGAFRQAFLQGDYSVGKRVELTDDGARALGGLDRSGILIYKVGGQSCLSWTAWVSLWRRLDVSAGSQFFQKEEILDMETLPNLVSMALNVPRKGWASTNKLKKRIQTDYRMIADFIGLESMDDRKADATVRELSKKYDFSIEEYLELAKEQTQLRDVLFKYKLAKRLAEDPKAEVSYDELLTMGYLLSEDFVLGFDLRKLKNHTQADAARARRAQARGERATTQEGRNDQKEIRIETRRERLREKGKQSYNKRAERREEEDDASGGAPIQMAAQPGGGAAPVREGGNANDDDSRGNANDDDSPTDYALQLTDIEKATLGLEEGETWELKDFFFFTEGFAEGIALSEDFSANIGEDDKLRLRMEMRVLGIGEGDLKGMDVHPREEDPFQD